MWNNLSSTQKSCRHLVVQRCHSMHHELWVIPIFGYSTLLTLIMVLLAILTKKIKRIHYKDSKKIKLLVATLILTVYTFVPLWFIFQGISEPNLSRLVYNIGTLIIVVLCQVILILSKTVPLVLCNYHNQLLTWKGSTQLQTEH